MEIDWTRAEKMDPHLLVGVVNTSLRNHFESLEDLCRTHDLQTETLVERLSNAGYQYLPEVNQFR